MTDIGHISNSPSTSAFTAPGRLEEPMATREAATEGAAPSRNLTPGDRVEISEHARHLARIKAMPEFRLEKVQAAREALENGSLDTSEHLTSALERMITDAQQL